ncbi:MAG: DUF4842 domain-containing protein [Prevotella ruminicola]|jgi:hypothetical protein|uniref:DUF4842 domain-containing protein n=1 Tax=Xylanibacter ruminicola TaxID=839 RepID=A0A928GGU6_XYLRU|nr:DUF4842 domain-containing protein [Xylanibacter ruminicola]
MIFNMKRIKYLAILALLGLSSCTQEFNYDPTQEIQENAENIFGLIDPNQDWRTTTSGTVTVTANAPLSDIAKVQILTESPFFNDQAKILAEAEVTAGQTVTLSYDAPRSNTRVIAACVDSNGKYFIKGFNLDDKEVSFNSSSSVATTRGLGITRGSSDLPDLSTVSLDFSSSFKSYNAIRSTEYSEWIGKNWEQDRLWQPVGSVSSNGWTMSNSVIYKDAPALSDEDAATLQDIFDASLSRYVNGKPRNNLQYINESSTVKLFGNHLESNGKAALTLCPVQMASTEACWCSIYYYYYRTADIPTGTTEADYIKALPKFKAIDVTAERRAFSANSGIAIDDKDATFQRLHEYLLPFYGNVSEFSLLPASLLSNGYTTDGKFYRIHNFSEDKNRYITNGSKTDDLKDAYTENVEEQLWQIFENHTDGTFMFYNVGSKKFLCYPIENDFPDIKDITESSLQKYTFYITDRQINATESRTKVFICTYDKKKFLKSVSGVNVGLAGAGTTGATREWSFEEYKSSTATPITDFELPANLYPADHMVPPSTKPSAIIPEGYRIGFMIRKNGGEGVSEKTSTEKQGCLYGYGELNTEINTYGQFKTAVSSYGMELNSPRMATFNANNKVYLCFEEGADTQYSDVIVEIGSAGETGVLMFDEVQEVENMAYTMCFEDRPNTADYDMNDVVLRCTRISSTKLQLTIVATGAQDDVYLNGIEGTSETDFNNKEVHSLLGVPAGSFVNTEPSAEMSRCVSTEYVVDESMTIPQFLSKIYIVNYSRGGDEIHVPKKGEPPYALIVPGDFDYPAERVSIINAYSAFRTWANNAYDYGKWLDSFDTSKLYINPFNRKTN